VQVVFLLQVAGDVPREQRDPLDAGLLEALEVDIHRDHKVRLIL
jgi:hypothetical protein